MRGFNTYDFAYKRWVAEQYGLPLETIARVAFDVQEIGLTNDEPQVELEIDVRMADGTRHLYTRSVSDFGTIINEVVEAAR